MILAQSQFLTNNVVCRLSQVPAQMVDVWKIHRYFKYLRKQKIVRRYLAILSICTDSQNTEVTLSNYAMSKCIEDNLLSQASEQMAKIEDTSLLLVSIHMVSETTIIHYLKPLHR